MSAEDTSPSIPEKNRNTPAGDRAGEPEAEEQTGKVRAGEEPSGMSQAVSSQADDREAEEACPEQSESGSAEPVDLRDGVDSSADADGVADDVRSGAANHEAAQDGAEQDPAAPAMAAGNGLSRHDGPSDRDGDDENIPEDEKPMSLTGHLGELRMRIVRMLLGALVGFLLCYGVAEELFYYLSLPLVRVMPPDTKFIYTSVPEGFFVYLKIAFVAGVFLASPYIFYQLWAFIAPGLYREERQHVLPLAFCSAVFFLLGAAFCYWGAFPFAFTFFMSYSKGLIVAMPSLNEYLGFALKMLLAFGLIFEMPLFAFFLARLCIITPAWMRKVRRYAILAIFIVAAILTPPDVFSQLLMAGPMIILYEISVYVAAIAYPRNKKTAKTARPDEAGSSDA